jgi:hypothetical protein
MFGGPWKVLMFGGPWKVPMFGGQWKVPMFGGQWKVPMFGYLWKVPLFGCPWKVPMLGALERFQCLVANGKRRRNTFSPLPTFSQQTLLKPSLFPLILRFYFTMVLSRYLCISFHFLDL